MLSPLLYSRRLMLRDFRPDDHAAYAMARSGREFARHYPPEELTPARSGQLLLRFLEQQRDAPRRGWQLAIVRVEDKALLGSVGLRGLGRGGEAGFGIELAESAWGQGYALEAARMMLDFGYRQLGWHRIWADCAPGNIAMLQLARRLGFVVQPLGAEPRLSLLLSAVPPPFAGPRREVLQWAAEARG
ncbi:MULTISPECIES: GNAT family N-acetyltransferase [Chromobacterium]|uniref:GNAT family N-acetyltransferase n=1 Tax=Chromobacterium TaxID=535 RepID=UPI001304EBDA|nr:MULTISPECIES: GNAT family N-acetyltransferase [Chromobacterium]MCP1291200.1 GNAT family N-acetyltransferase [Chromobacterium sp. S0633]UJB32952.1 GNAT family N-acetyltransferase [Chromobacterium sp. Beijing]